eukprot:TRINITY_DN681_c0_g1_i1.p1 TRINITY_DN681_c0_g1~~TRINITY_DN681_c0_g1_i1.p1  ORF type:complete len:296 (-),score=51.51 TRINITY_DN681_c0_g1_i1:31-918(-)
MSSTENKKQIVAVVTGANKGLGYSSVKYLLKELGPNAIVYLTARDEGRGKEAVEKLKAEGLHPHFFLLDIASKESVDTFVKYISDTHGGVDIFIANASAAVEKDCKWPLQEQAKYMIFPNNYGNAYLIEKVVPLLRENARYLLVSSGFGTLAELGENLKTFYTKPDLTVKDINDSLQAYIDACKDGPGNPQLKKLGWPDWPNKPAKVGLVALARVWARDLEKTSPTVLVNAVCPGWTVTDTSISYLDENKTFNGIKAKTPDEAAVDMVWPALLPAGSTGPRGELIQYRKIIPFVQ